MEWNFWTIFAGGGVIFIIAGLVYSSIKDQRDEFDFPVHDESYKDDE